MSHVIHGRLVGLTVIILFGIEISAAFMIVSDISWTFFVYTCIFSHFQSFQKYSIHLIGSF